MRIATMQVEDLERALDWAAEEGWNPGLDDAAAFLAADPGGFLMGWEGDEPVAAISVVRHSESFGFLGLFLCPPASRGKGYGRAIWDAGLALLGERTIGLDGVEEQEANYARLGFALSHRTLRHRGPVVPEPWPRLVPCRAEHLPGLFALDRRSSGVEREAYLRSWFAEAPTRQTMVLEDEGEILAYGTVRVCREGAKVGPLHAADPADAVRLLRALAVFAPPEGGISLDVPEPNYAAGALVRELGFVPVFATARMYRGPAPEQDFAADFGEVTLELG